MKHSLESVVLYNFYASQDGLLSPNNLLFFFLILQTMLHLIKMSISN